MPGRREMADRIERHVLPAKAGGAEPGGDVDDRRALAREALGEPPYERRRRPIALRLREDGHDEADAARFAEPARPTQDGQREAQGLLFVAQGLGEALVPAAVAGDRGPRRQAGQPTGDVRVVGEQPPEPERALGRGRPFEGELPRLQTEARLPVTLVVERLPEHHVGEVVRRAEREEDDVGREADPDVLQDEELLVGSVALHREVDDLEPVLPHVQGGGEGVEVRDAEAEGDRVAEDHDPLLRERPRGRVHLPPAIAASVDPVVGAVEDHGHVSPEGPAVAVGAHQKPARVGEEVRVPQSESHFGSREERGAAHDARDDQREPDERPRQAGTPVDGPCRLTHHVFSLNEHYGSRQG